MNKKNEASLLEHYLKLFICKRWIVIIPYIAVMALGIYWSLITPQIYEAKTLILVEPQRVPGAFVRNIVSADINSRIATISQQIMSRSNLEKIIEKYNLFSAPEQTHMYMEDKLANLRDRISIRVQRTRSGGDAFSISYRDSDPRLTMEVANTLSSFFIDTNVQIREKQASGTSSFLDSELNIMRSKLEGMDSQFKDFRKQYMGELPEQMNANLRILESLQLQLSEKKERLRDEKSRLMIINNEIDQIRKDEAQERRANAQAAASLSVPNQAQTDQPTLQQMQEELAALRSSYTDKHPDVIRLSNKIKEIEKSKSKQTSSPDSNDNQILPSALEETPSTKLLENKLRQRMAANTEILNLKQDILDINNEVSIYKGRIERTPRREEELRALKRDYENVQSAYNSLLSRKMEADIAVNLEKNKKGEQFRVLDLAKIPEKPISPNLKKIFLMALILGLGSGGGLVLFLDFWDSSVRRLEDLSKLEIPVLATIPILYNSKSKWLHSMNKFATSLSLLVAIILTGGFAFLSIRGVNPALAIIRKYLA